jgi:hypothetical protein
MVTNLHSPQRRRGHGEESFCPFAGDTANGQVARPPSVEVDPCHPMDPLFPKGVQSSELLIQTLLPQAESRLSFAGISPAKTGYKHRQMKDLNFSVSSVPRW